MASSKVMASTSPANPDLPRQSSSIHPLSDLHSDPTKNFGSMNMDDLFKNIYADPENFPAAGGGLTKTADEVWKEIMAGSGENMTLEDYLTKEGAISKEDVDVGLSSEMVPAPGYVVDSVILAPPQFQPPAINMQSAGGGLGGFGVETVGFGSGIVAVAGGGGGRGKRRAVEEPPVDRATQQKQKRMIKNRESAARSRERKQAYTVELESLVTQLEEEKARLMREEKEITRERFKQLIHPPRTSVNLANNDIPRPILLGRKIPRPILLDRYLQKIVGQSLPILQHLNNMGPHPVIMSYRADGELDTGCGEAKTTKISSENEFTVNEGVSIYGL